MSLVCNYNAAALHSAVHANIRNGDDALSRNRPLPSSSWSLPASSLPARNKIPSPALFKGLPNTASSSPDSVAARESQPYSVAECAVHLELLQVFYYLRQHVLDSKELDDMWETATLIPQSPQYEAKRKAKWPLFTKLATLRFFNWIKETDSKLADEAPGRRSVDVPPLDILMVWHSLLITPHRYRDFCSRHGYERIRDVPFPWKAIHDQINRETWEFTPPEEPSSLADSLETNNLFSYVTKNDRAKLVHDIFANLIGATLSDRDIGRAIGRTERLEVTDPNFLNEVCKGLQETMVEPASELADGMGPQTGFIDKMDEQLWIVSPAVLATLMRAIDRYTKFIALLKLYPETVLVPTVDIDLVWHTHQCWASRYEADISNLAGRFVIHNDELDPESRPASLDVGMETTAQLWRVRFGTEYNTCHCWDCEALLSAAMEVGDHQKEKGNWNSAGVNTDTVSQTVGDYLTYYRFMEVARRKGKTLPVR